MAEEALALHRERHGNVFAILIKDEDYLPKVMDWLLAGNEGRGLQITPVSSYRMHDRSGPVERRSPGGKKRLLFKDGGGAFRVSVGRHEIHLVRVRLNKGLTREYAAGTERAFLALHAKLREGRNDDSVLPKKGLWTATSYNSRMHYEQHEKKAAELKKFVGHPAFAALKQDMESFFDNVGYFTKYGQQGVRRVLLSGPPGTGKTSIGLALLASMESRALCLDCSGDEGVVGASFDIADKQRPAILLAEELDTFCYGGEVNQELLHWLDGSRGGANKAGTYIIFTTNYPERIDPRILKRPGRIDRVISVDALSRHDARAIARMYLPKGLKLPVVELGRVLDRTTPAEIKEIINIAFGMARSEATNVSIELLRRARAELLSSLQEAGEIARGDMDARFEEFNRRGPRPDAEDFDDGLCL
ncbi:MAG: ATP-binding protein [Pseudolabrys sp.]